MNKFEQLIEYVINNEESKARELFHDIVVEKSRTIYEEMMDAEDAKDGQEEVDEQVEEALGGDQTDDFIADVEVEEQGLSMEGEGEDDGEGMAQDEAGEEELEDRVVDLEDKLDELMAEFEALMGDESGDDMGGMDDMADGGDDGEFTVGMDSEEVVDDELETEGMFENVALKAVPKPTHGDHGANSKSPVAANSGAKGAVAKPVHATGDGGNGRPAPTAKDAIGKVGNSPAQSTQKPTPATKPNLAQATGVNTKSVIQ